MHRDFTAAYAEAAGERPTFTIRAPEGSRRFTCAPLNAVPGGTVFDLIAAPEREENPALFAAIAVDFINSVLADPDRQDFNRLIRKPWSPGWWPITDVELEAVAVWLIETYTGRPTLASEPSSEASSPTGPSSKPVSSLPVSSRLGPPPVDLEEAARARAAAADAPTTVLGRAETFPAASSASPPGSSSLSRPAGT